jgi:hydroxymethylpyrimidine/phosphomethylpyrimidine kinase
MQGDGVTAYLEALIPYADIVTPNLREAALLCGVNVEDVVTHDDMLNLANQILASGVTYVLVKGGHFRGEEGHSPDILVGAGEVQVFSAERVTTDNDHGTGCSLSAAIASGLALGRPMNDSVRDAKSFVLSALKGSADWKLGRGRGPIDHLGWNQ